jgi:hypothetical protein
MIFFRRCLVLLPPLALGTELLLSRKLSAISRQLSANTEFRKHWLNAES